jgi:glycosyltransferase involved in cell wall biosynthesis
MMLVAPKKIDNVPTSAAGDHIVSPAAIVPGAPEVGRSDQKLRVAVVTPIPTPYRDPFWNELARRPEIDLTVYYCAAGKSDRPWKDDWHREYRSEVLSGWNLLRWRGADASCFWNPTLNRRLADGRFDAILIGGYNHLTMWGALWFAVRRKIPYFLMCESHLRSHRAGWKQLLKRPALRWIVRHAAGFLPTGRLATEFLQSYGADAKAMTLLPNVPDVVRLAAEVDRHRDQADFPGPAGLAGRPLVLFVGRLIPKKRAELVIRAFHAIHSTNDAVLVIVGDGPLRSGLETIVAELEIGDRVHFAGFVQPDEVLHWYAHASLFVLPSSETWGVVVIEAMAAGIPVVVSDEVGCHVDVVANEALGTVVPARNFEALRDALQRLLEDPAGTERFLAAWSTIEPGLRYDVLARNLTSQLTADVRGHRGADQ